MKTALLATWFLLAWTTRTHEIIMIRNDVPLDKEIESLLKQACAAYWRWEKLTYERVPDLYDRCIK